MAQYQSFDVPNIAHLVAKRTTLLRDQIHKHTIDGYLVPRADEFQGEYVPEAAERLSYITGFTGSWGLSLILKDRADLYIDSRYKIQAPEQTDLDIFNIVCISDNPLSKRLSESSSAVRGSSAYGSAMSLEFELARRFSLASFERLTRTSALLSCDRTQSAATALVIAGSISAGAFSASLVPLVSDSSSSFSLSRTDPPRMSSSSRSSSDASCFHNGAFREFGAYSILD